MAAKKYKSYDEYLKSEKWRETKAEYAKNEQTGECLVCRKKFDNDNIKPNFHHFKYSRDWNNDQWQNLIIICECCHEFLHDSFDHDSNEISLRDYLSSAVNAYCKYQHDEIYEIEMWDIAQELLKCNIVLNSNAVPSEIICKNITISHPPLASRLLKAQIHKASKG